MAFLFCIVLSIVRLKTCPKRRNTWSYKAQPQTQFCNVKLKNINKMQNSILLQNVSPEQFTEMIKTVLAEQMKQFKIDLNNKDDKDDLLTRDQVLELLQVNSSTLWHWTNKGKINVYKFANKCYYKRSEIMQSITLKK